MPRVAVPVRSKEPMFIENFAQRSQDSFVDNWRKYIGSYGLQDQASDRPEHIWEMLHREDARGNLVSRLIFEPDRRSRVHDGRMHVSFARWFGVESELRQFLIEGVEERRAEDRAAGRPEMTIGFYVGSFTNGSPYTTNLRTATGQLNLRNRRDRRKWEYNILPWVDCGMLSELWYDAGARSTNWTQKHWDMTRSNLEQQRNRYGLYGGTEALPHTRDSDSSTPWPQDINWIDPGDTPVHCISRFILDRDPGGLIDVKERWGANREVHVQSSQHLRLNGMSGALRRHEARDFAARGWVVGSWMRPEDWIVNLPVVDVPRVEQDIVEPEIIEEIVEQEFVLKPPVTKDGVERDINELR